MEKKFENVTQIRCISLNMKKCITCKHFRRSVWHKSNGRCEILAKALMPTNSQLIWNKSLHVEDTFGCIFHKIRPKQKAIRQIRYD
jgi:hypothetical protein